MTYEARCPSGLAGAVRKLKLKECNLLADRKAMRGGDAFTKILEQCWVRTDDAGPYELNGTGPNWSTALVCDRFYALMCARVATWGDNYAFTIQCEGSTCRKRIEWELKLTDLPYRELPEESRERVAAGDTSFELKLVGGDGQEREVKFHLQTGAGERRSMKFLERQNSRIVVASLASRIDSVDGVPRGSVSRWLDDLDADQLDGILEKFDEVDGGVETTIDIECDSCGLVQEVELPLAGEFWLPLKRRRSAKSPVDQL
jgi:hypothetical protein